VGYIFGITTLILITIHWVTGGTPTTGNNSTSELIILSIVLGFAAIGAKLIGHLLLIPVKTNAVAEIEVFYLSLKNGIQLLLFAAIIAADITVWIKMLPNLSFDRTIGTLKLIEVLALLVLVPVQVPIMIIIYMLSRWIDKSYSAETFDKIWPQPINYEDSWSPILKRLEFGGDMPIESYRIALKDLTLTAMIHTAGFPSELSLQNNISTISVYDGEFDLAPGNAEVKYYDDEEKLHIRIVLTKEKFSYLYTTALNPTKIDIEFTTPFFDAAYGSKKSINNPLKFEYCSFNIWSKYRSGYNKVAGNTQLPLKNGKHTKRMFNYKKRDY
jgi:hypothetical protein